MYVDTKISQDATAIGDGRLAAALRGTGRYRGTRAPLPIDDSAWTEFLASGRARIERFDSHEMVFHEDDGAHHLYEVASGSIMLYRLLGDGRRQVVDILSAGDLFGMSATGLTIARPKPSSPPTSASSTGARSRSRSRFRRTSTVPSSAGSKPSTVTPCCSAASPPPSASRAS